VKNPTVKPESDKRSELLALANLASEITAAVARAIEAGLPGGTVATVLHQTGELLTSK
jgi:hypothetical protein